MENNEKILNMTLMLIRVGMGISDISQEAVKYEPDLIYDVYRLAKHHDLSHIVAYAVKKKKLECDGEVYAKLDKQHMISMFRYQHQRYDLDMASKALEEAEIPHIPLKGSVLRSFYPLEWMRTGCDIDILVKPENLDAAIDALVTKCSYKLQAKNSHDVSLDSPGGTHIELHYDLIEDYIHGKDTVLERFWESAVPAEGKKYRLLVSDAMFYYYHVAHSAKHVVNGGCGIRPFLDFWVLENKIGLFDKAARKELLAEGGYDKFADCASALSQAWFGGAEHTNVTKKLESFIISGGVYGNIDNKVAVNTVKRGSRFKYMIRRIFPSYNSLRFYYPSLDGKKYLLPAYWVRRWFRLVFCGGLGRSVREIKATGSVSADRQNETAVFLSDIGIN